MRIPKIPRDETNKKIEDVLQYFKDNPKDTAYKCAKVLNVNVQKVYYYLGFLVKNKVIKVPKDSYGQFIWNKMTILENHKLKFETENHKLSTGKASKRKTLLRKIKNYVILKK